MLLWIGVLVAGGLGAVLRFLVDGAVARRAARSFPYGTFVVNISGAALLGLLGSLALSRHVALIADTAFVGSYTTFSTWMLETQRLSEERQIRRAATNIVGQRRGGHRCGATRAMDCGPTMNQPCLKLTAYFGERQRAVADVRRPGFLADAMLDLFDTRDIAASVMLRGIASFGPRHVLRTDESLSLSEDPPVAIAAVDVEAKISGLVDDVVAMTGRGLVTLERARLVGGDERDRRRHRRQGQAHGLCGAPGTDRRATGVPRGVRSAVSARILRWRSLFGRRRYGAW